MEQELVENERVEKLDGGVEEPQYNSQQEAPADDTEERPE